MKKFNITQIALVVLALIIISGSAYAAFTQGRNNRKDSKNENQTSVVTNEESTPQSTRTTISEDLPDFSFVLPEGFSIDTQSSVINEANKEQNFFNELGDSIVTSTITGNDETLIIRAVTNSVMTGVGIPQCYNPDSFTKAGEFYILKYLFNPNGRINNQIVHPKEIIRPSDELYKEFVKDIVFFDENENQTTVPDGYYCIRNFVELETVNNGINPATSEKYGKSVISFSYEDDREISEKMISLVESIQGLTATDEIDRNQRMNS